MSSHQGGQGGRGRRGGRQYDSQGRGGANPNWRGNPSPHTGSEGQSAGYVGQRGRVQYTSHMRGPQSGYIGSTPRGPSPQQVYDQPGSGEQYPYQDLDPRPHQQSGWAQRGSNPQQVYALPGSGAQYQHQDLNPRHPQPSGWAQRGPSPQQLYAQPGSGAQSQHQDLNPRVPQQSGWAQRGPSHQQVYGQPGNRAQKQYQDLNPRPPQQSGLAQGGLPPQTIRDLPTHYPAPAQQQEAHRPFVGTTPDLHQAKEPRLAAPIPQATLVASDGLAALEGQMTQLTLPPSSTKVTKFPRRPGQGKLGERVVVRAHHFLVQLQAKTLYHYNVTIISRGTNRAIMQALLKVYQHSNLNGRLPVYDGSKSIYTAGPLPFESKRFDITLSDEDLPL